MWMPFLLSGSPGAKPFEPFRERLECSEAEARDVGPAVLRPRVCSGGRPFSSQPGRSGRAAYTCFEAKGKVERAGPGAGAGQTRAMAQEQMPDIELVTR